MTRVSYFQRFSQKENHATNNTLLVMRFFYQHSPQKLEFVLSELVGEELRIGLSFEQQIKSEMSVPDALISQRPLELFFETKRGGKLDKKQIERHIASIKGGTQDQARKILFGLTSRPISEQVKRDLSQKAARASVTFIAITFSEIASALRQCCAPHESDLQDVLNDYEAYLRSDKLTHTDEVMTVVPCGTSMAENIAYRIYFEPSSRPSKARSKFIGLYSDKRVQHIGRLKTVVTGKPDGNAFNTVDVELGEPTEDEIDRIREAIKACAYFPDLQEEITRYYLFDELEETAIQKTSKGGIWGARVFDLQDWLNHPHPGTEYDTKAAANLLRGQTFE